MFKSYATFIEVFFVVSEKKHVFTFHYNGDFKPLYIGYWNVA